MNKFKLFFVFCSLTACAYKPISLSNKENLITPNFCLKTNDRSNINRHVHDVSGDWADNHHYDDHLYYYNLSDYINLTCIDQNSQANLSKLTVGQYFENSSKGKSYRRLLFDVTAEIYRDGEFIIKQEFNIESKTPVASFTTSKEERAAMTSDALRNGFEKLVQKIEYALNGD